VNPHGVMSYASIVNLSLELTALSVPSNYGSGVQWADGLMKDLPHAYLQLGLWMVGLTDAIKAGHLDRDIYALGSYLAGLNRPVFLRIGYEFDSASNNYDPTSYKKAFRRIVGLFSSKNITNVAFVWHASGFEPRNGLKLDSWFPGPEYVDWCGVSFFQQPYDCQVATKCSFPYAEALVEFCSKTNGIPIMIAESTPFGGLVDESREEINEAGFGGSSWNSWFVPVLEFIEKYDVKMWCYINADWDALPMWQRERAPDVHWGDSRVQEYDGVRARWTHDVLENSRYAWMVDPSGEVIEKERKSRSNSHQRLSNASAIPPEYICATVHADEVKPYPYYVAIGLLASVSAILALMALVFVVTKRSLLSSSEYVMIR
jgi:hypothetical protein